MRTLFVTLALGLCLGAQAGPPHDGPPDMDIHIAHMTERLGLTTDQEARVRTILETTQDEAEGLRDAAHQAIEQLRAARASEDDVAMDQAISLVLETRAEAEALRGATQEQVREVLTTAQAADMVLAEITRRHRMGEMMRTHGEQKPPGRDKRLRGL